MAPVAMARGRLDTVGILESADWAHNHLPESRKRGIQDALAPHGLHLMIFRMADAELAPVAVPLKLDGKEFCLPPRADGMVKAIRRRRDGAKVNK